MPVGAAVAAIAVIALVGLGFLFGRGPVETRRVYLLVVSGVSLLVLAFGVITALFGVVDVSLPGSVRSVGGRGAVVRSIRVGPGMAAGGGVMVAPNRNMGGQMPAGPGMVMVTRRGSSGSVRSAGIVRILRGVILALVAGAIFWYHWVLAPEPAAEPRAETAPPRRTRRT
jgi:hypothetical protein